MKKCTKCKIEKSFSEFYRRGKSYKSHCKECSSIHIKEYYALNKEAHNRKMKEHYESKISDYKKNHKKYRKDNSEKIKDIAKNYVKKRRKNDSLFKLILNMRCRVYDYLKIKNISKKNTTFDLVGCSPEELKKYLEIQFKTTMNWENYGKWHIDHIIPLASAKNEEELYKLCHYTNLQPMWASENRKKGCKII